MACGAAAVDDRIDGELSGEIATLILFAAIVSLVFVVSRDRRGQLGLIGQEDGASGDGN